MSERLKIIVTDDFKTKVYLDGQRVQGVRSVEFQKRLDDPQGDIGDLKLELVPGGTKIGENN